MQNYSLNFNRSLCIKHSYAIIYVFPTSFQTEKQKQTKKKFGLIINLMLQGKVSGIYLSSVSTIIGNVYESE